jgi:WD40 repeat protein
MAGEIQKISLQDKKIDVLANIEPKELFEKRTAIGFLDGDNYFYTPSRDSIKLADITIQVIEEQETHDTIKSLLPSTDNSILAIETDWKGTSLWDRASGQFIRKLPSPIHHWAFSSDGNKIAFSTKDSERGYIQIEEARTGQLLQKFIVHGSNDVFFAFDQTDERLITGSANDHTMRLWQRKNSADNPHGKYTEVKKQTYHFNQQFLFAFLPDGNIVVGRRGGDLEVWSPELTTKICCDIQIDYDPLWCINERRRELILAEREQTFYKVDLTTGTASSFKPQLDRPEYVPNSLLRKEFNCRSGAALWRGFGGPYVHITDGPRGWATPIHISLDQKFVVLPGQGEIAVISIAEEQSIRARLPFEGRLRAAYVDDEKIMAVDSKGKLIAKKYGP